MIQFELLVPKASPTHARLWEPFAKEEVPPQKMQDPIQQAQLSGYVVHVLFASFSVSLLGALMYFSLSYK